MDSKEKLKENNKTVKKILLKEFVVVSTTRTRPYYT